MQKITKNITVKCCQCHRVRVKGKWVKTGSDVGIILDGVCEDCFHLLFVGTFENKSKPAKSRPK